MVDTGPATGKPVALDQLRSVLIPKNQSQPQEYDIRGKFSRSIHSRADSLGFLEDLQNVDELAAGVPVNDPTESPVHRNEYLEDARAATHRSKIYPLVPYSSHDTGFRIMENLNWLAADLYNVSCYPRRRSSTARTSAVDYDA